jgi:ABC-2 type transport system ATP-binding protein
MRRALTEAGLVLHQGAEQGLPGAGHILLVEATGEETYDVVRDTVAALGVGLVRMEQRRHQIAEVFRDNDQHAHGRPAQPADAQPAHALQQKGAGSDGA